MRDRRAGKHGLTSHTSEHRVSRCEPQVAGEDGQFGQRCRRDKQGLGCKRDLPPGDQLVEGQVPDVEFPTVVGEGQDDARGDSHAKDLEIPEGAR